MAEVSLVTVFWYAVGAAWLTLILGVLWQAKHLSERDGNSPPQYKRFLLRSSLLAGLFTIAVLVLGLSANALLAPADGLMLLFVCLASTGTGLLSFASLGLSATGHDLSRWWSPLDFGPAMADYIGALVEDLR